MTKHSHDWFYRFSPRNGGDMQDISATNRETILNAWAEQKTKREISDMTGLHINTVRKIVRNARTAGDPRGFAKTKPLMSASCVSVIEMTQQAWFVRGLAERLEIHVTQAESIVRSVIKDMEQDLTLSKSTSTVEIK